MRHGRYLLVFLGFAVLGVAAVLPRPDVRLVSGLLAVGLGVLLLSRHRGRIHHLLVRTIGGVRRYLSEAVRRLRDTVRRVVTGVIANRPSVPDTDHLRDRLSPRRGTAWREAANPARLRAVAIAAVTRQRLIVAGTALILFAIHFWLQWTFTYRYIEMAGGLGGIIDKFNVLLDGGLTRSNIQINNYTGNPFFLLPLVQFLGYTPEAVRAALIFTKAGTTAMFFLAYYLLFGYRKAVMGAIILFSMSEWIYWRWFDHTYTGFLIGILVVLYAAWVNAGSGARSPHLYAIAFLGGLFFYFKTTVLYLLAGMGLAALYRQGVGLLRDAPLMTLLALFLVGATPFIAYNVTKTDQINRTQGSSTSISIGGKADLTVSQAIVGRFDQLGRWMRSDVYNLDTAILADPSAVRNYPFGYPFNTKNGPGGEVRQGIDTVAVLTGDGYNRHYFNGIHLLSVLLVLSMVWLLYTRQHVHLVIVFLVMFLFHIILPSSSGLRTGHMNLLVPFVPLLYLAALDTVPPWMTRKRVYRAGGIVVAAVFLISIVVTVATLPPNTTDVAYDTGQWRSNTWSPGTISTVPLTRWGGDQLFYDTFAALDIDDRVVTNAFRVHLITWYFRDLDSAYLIPPNVTLAELDGPKPQLIGDRRRIGCLQEPTPVTVILRETLPCTPGTEFCGAATEDAIATFDLDPASMERMTLYNHTYLVARNISGPVCETPGS